MGLRKNVAGQKVAVFLTQQTDNGNDYDFGTAQMSANWHAGKTAAAASLAAGSGYVKISIDGGAFANLTNSFTELDATAMPGVYIATLTQAETNGDTIVIALLPPFSSASAMPRQFVLKTDPDWESNLMGTGQTVPGDTLAEIRDALDSAVFPVLRSGQATTELSGTGWLSRIVTKVRTYTDVPSTSAKFYPSRMLETIRDSIRELFSDPAITGPDRLFVRHTFTLVSGQDHYTLPPGVGSIFALSKMNTDGTTQYETRPSGPENPSVFAWWREGNTLRFVRNTALAGETLTVLYTPNGDIRPFKATASAVAGDGTTVTFPSTVTDGSLDVRENAYAGYTLRVVSATSNGYEQEMAISAYNNQTRVATLVRPLSPVPSGTVVVEVVPVYVALFEDVLALHVARTIVSTEGNTKRLEMLTQRYREKARALRLSMANAERRNGGQYEGRTRDNEAYVGGTNWWWYSSGYAVS